MKKSSIPALLGALLLLACVCAGCAKTKPKEIRGILRLRFTYSCGMRSTDQVVYTLEKTGEGTAVTPDQKQYQLIDDVWTEVTDEAGEQADDPSADAA